MINLLDNLLRHLFVSQVAAIANDTQVGFRPPDNDWRTEVLNLQSTALNVYLVDLRENRKLRTNARVRDGVVNGDVILMPAPARVDCHYLITAWSPVQPGPALEPTPDEHALLYEALAALMEAQPLDPRRVYGEGHPLLPTLPELFLGQMPSQVLPVEGFLKQPEFWGTMGTDHRWRPGLFLIVTLPLALAPIAAGPPVTTRAARLRRGDMPQAVDERYQIAGLVLDATGADDPERVAGAWVRLNGPAGQPLRTTFSDVQGRFDFADIAAGDYQLEWRAVGLDPPAAPRLISVPSPTGEYDLMFT